MKTTMTTKAWALAALLLVGFTACKKNNPTPDPQPDPIGTENLTITQLKALSTGSSVTITKEKTLYKVKGVVISDNSATGKNIDAKTAIIAQEDNAVGIVVNFASAHNFAAGTEVEIGVSNQKLEQVSGEIVLNAVPVDSAKSIATGKTVTLKETTIADIIAKKTTYDGTLVKIAATQLLGGNGNFEGTLTVKDETGELKSEVQSTAAFVGDAYPVSVSAITGIVRISGDAVRVDIRKADDVVVGEYIRVDVEYFNFNEIITIISSQQVQVGHPFFADNVYARVTAGMTLPLGSWVGGSTSKSFYDAKAPGQEPDKGFLSNPDRRYMYLWTTGTNAGLGFKSEGLKAVTITFAGTKRTSLYYDNTSASGTITPAAPVQIGEFQEGTDYVELKVSPLGEYNAILTGATGTSFRVDKVGEFFTVTYVIPTAEELQAMGVQGDINMFLQSPGFFIQNVSSRNRAVIIDKIELKY